MGSLLRIPSNSDFLGIIWLRVLAEELDFYTKLIAQSFTAAGISGQKWLELTFMPFRVMFSALESAISKTCLSLRISFPFRGRRKRGWGICPPDFDRLWAPHYYLLPGFSDLPTALPLVMSRPENISLKRCIATHGRRRRSAGGNRHFSQLCCYVCCLSQQEPATLFLKVL